MRWVQQQLDRVVVAERSVAPQPIVAVCDTTFFGRGYGVLVIRCPRLKQHLHCQEVTAETPAMYQAARKHLEDQGFIIEAAVVDGKRGMIQVFADVPVQLCQFHQVAIVTRYLTRRPKLQAGKELRAITLALTQVNQATFTALLAEWFEHWKDFLKERTTDEVTGRWQYTHRRIRAAYRSLSTNLPYLFTYQQYPALQIPNTTNSLDGSFGWLKQLLNIHRGLTIKRRYKLIQEILS